MASTQTGSQAADIVCPDPSAHSKKTAQHADASKAAMLATSPGKDKIGSNKPLNVLDADGKLSAAGAATSLKYAQPKDLPSFPSVGIEPGSSGYNAAQAANANHKQVEYWRPSSSASAGKAALLASKERGKVDLWHPEASKAGQSAAGMAMHRNLSPQLDYGYTSSGHTKAVSAASQSLSGRARAGSTPTNKTQSYPDAHNSSFNALNAANAASRPSAKQAEELKHYNEATEASRITHSHMSREMFTEHPPVALEVEEKQHQAALRASAVSMAKQMMAIQQKQSAEASMSQGEMAAKSVANKHQSISSIGSDELRSQMRGLNLQEAAQRLAAERLAKLDPDGVMAYREHYGYKMASPRNRLSMRARPKRGSVDESDSESSDDEVQAGRIRRRQNKLNDEVASVDEVKKQQDRSNLMAAAERLVRARMHVMDQKVFDETGNASPAMMEEWEAKAKAKAAAESEKRMQTHGKVHIGGGKYMDQSEVDAIAQARMQPTFDEINDTAEKKRARDEEVRLDRELRETKSKEEKEREKEVKAELKRAQDKAKAESRKQKEAEKARIAEEKRVAKEEKRKSKAEKTVTEIVGTGALTTTSPTADPATEEVSKDISSPAADPATEEVSNDVVSPTESETGEHIDEPVSPVDSPALDAEPSASAEPSTKVEPDAIAEPDASMEPTPEVMPAAEPASTEPRTIINMASFKSEKKDSKGIKGFFGKLRRGSNKKAEEKPAAGTSEGYGASGGLFPKDNSAEPGEAEHAMPATAERSPSPSLSSKSGAEAVEAPGGKAEDDIEEARDTVDDDFEPPKSRVSKDEGSTTGTSSKFHEDVD